MSKHDKQGKGDRGPIADLVDAQRASAGASPPVLGVDDNTYVPPVPEDKRTRDVYLKAAVKIGEQHMTEFKGLSHDQCSENAHGIEMRIHPTRNFTEDTTRTVEVFVPWANVNAVVRS